LWDDYKAVEDVEKDNKVDRTGRGPLQRVSSLSKRSPISPRVLIDHGRAENTPEIPTTPLRYDPSKDLYEEEAVVAASEEVSGVPEIALNSAPSSTEDETKAKAKKKGPSPLDTVKLEEMPDCETPTSKRNKPVFGRPRSFFDPADASVAASTLGTSAVSSSGAVIGAIGPLATTGGGASKKAKATEKVSHRDALRNKLLPSGISRGGPGKTIDIPSGVPSLAVSGTSAGIAASTGDACPSPTSKRTRASGADLTFAAVAEAVENAKSSKSAGGLDFGMPDSVAEAAETSF